MDPPRSVQLHCGGEMMVTLVLRYRCRSLCSPLATSSALLSRACSSLLCSIDNNSIPTKLGLFLSLIYVRLSHALLDLLEDQLANHTWHSIANLLADVRLGTGEAMVSWKAPKQGELLHVEGALATRVDVACTAVTGDCLA